MEALEKDFQDLVDSEEVLQEDEADDTSPADLSDEVSADDELIDEKSAAQDIVDKVLSEEDDDITDEQQEIIEFLLSELDEEDLDLISELDDEEDWDATLDSIFEKKSKAERKKAAKKKAKWLKTGGGKKSLKKQAKRQKKVASGAIKIDKSRSKAMRKASKLYNTYDPSVDVTALVGDSELSEEFKTKASTIFEAAVNREVESRTKQFDENLNGILVECTEEVMNDLTEKVDSYLDYVVEEWMQENEIAIESGIRAELTEDFIVGLKTLFTQHYVDIPDTKVDVLSELATKVEELEEKLNTQINENIELKKEVSSAERDELIRGVSTDLVETEVEKLKELSEGIEYDGDDEEFTSKLQTLCESYFPKGKVSSPVTNEPVVYEDEDLSVSMSAYSNAISRTNQSSKV